MSRGVRKSKTIPDGVVTPALYPDFVEPTVFCVSPTFDQGNCTLKLPTYKHDEPTWTMGLNYRIDARRMIYATVSRGFRSGGFNLRGVDSTTFGPFQPEIVRNYELGLKADWTIGGALLRTNLAVYHQRYNDIQRTLFAQFPGTTVAAAVVRNAAAAKIEGAEAEVTFVPVHALELSGFTSYTRARYSNFTFNIAANPDGSGSIPVDLSGAAFSGVPETQFGLSGKYALPVPDTVGTLSAQANYYHQSSFFWSDTNEAGALSPGYGLLDLRLTWANVLQRGMDMSLWGKNVLDTKYKASGVSTGLTVGYQSYIPGPPATFGIDLRYAF